MTSSWNDLGRDIQAMAHNNMSSVLHNIPSTLLYEPIHRGDNLAAVDLPSEAHLEAWEDYLTESQIHGTWPTLSKYFVQLRFPIKSGISRTPAYKAATQRGKAIDIKEAGELLLKQSEQLTLTIHQSIAGPIPVIMTANHADFASLVQALTNRNEPVLIPKSMGACLVSGYINWDRIHKYHIKWQTETFFPTASAWQEELKRLIPQKHLYQDRFIILYCGPYSNIPATELGLETAEWLSLSLQLRLEHECAHYFTKRVFGIVRQHLHDELLADYAGIVAAVGYYRADWFLHFMGLEEYPHYRPGGRLENYLDQSLQQEPAFTHVKAALVAAAHNLEEFDRSLANQERDMTYQRAILCALASTSLADLAADGGNTLLANRVAAWHATISSPIKKI